MSGFAGSQLESGGEADAFAPILRGPSSLLFLDLSGAGFDSGFNAGNVALGYRQMLANGVNIGGYIGGDILDAPLDKVFFQGAVGVELTSRLLDFRANGYLPDTRSHLLNSSTQTATSTSTTTGSGAAAPQLVLQGNQLLLQNGGSTTTTTTTTTTSLLSELGYAGFDGEVGVHGPISAMLRDIDAELRLYAGGFYFHNGDGQAALPGFRAAKTIAGPKARLELAFNNVVPELAGSQLTLEAQYSYDDVRRDQGYVGLRLRIPFSFGPQATYNVADDQERRLHDRLRRDREILVRTRALDTTATSTTSTTTGRTTERVEDAATDVPIDRVAFADATTGITAVATANGANTLIVADGSKGTITGPQTLQASQTLLGGGSNLLVQGVTTRTQATFTAPGTRPTIQEPTNTVLTVASNDHINGVDLRGGSGNGVLQDESNQGIVGPGSLQNLVIENNTIEAFGATAISLADGNSNVTIKNNTIANAQFTGIFIGSNNSNISIASNNISNIGISAITINDHNTNASIQTNQISDVIFHFPPTFNGFGGIVFDSPNAISVGGSNKINILNNDISNIGASGIILQSNNNFQIAGNTVSNIGQNILFPSLEDVPVSMGGGGGPYALVFASSNTGTIASNTFGAPVTQAALGSFDFTRPSVGAAGDKQGIGNTVTGSGNVLTGSPTPTACGNLDAAHNPGTNIKFTDGSHCP